MSQDSTDTGESKKKSSSFRPGCGLWLLLAGFAMLGGGIYLMNGWDNLPGGARAGAVILVVLGTLVLLPFVLFIGIRILIRVFAKKLQKDLKDAVDGFAASGEAMVGANKAMYGKIHEFRPAADRDFALLDRSLYSNAQQELADLGYRFLSDVVDQTIEEINHHVTVIRVMASTDGSTVAGVYHFVPKQSPPGFEGRPIFICDLATEFSDGTFLTTSNSSGLDLTTAATGIDRRQHRLETSITQLERLHQTEKQKLLVAKNGATCTIVNNRAEAMEFSKRQQALKNAFRKQIGYVDPEEVRRIAKQSGHDDDFVDQAANAADEARQKEREA